MRRRIFGLLTDLAARHPWSVLGVGAALALGGALLASQKLSLNANTNDLIAQDRPFMAPYRAFLREFGDLEFIFIVVDAEPDRAAAEHAIDRLIELLTDTPGLSSVHRRVEPHEQLRLATRAMPDVELRTLTLAADGMALLAQPEMSATAVATRAAELLRGATGANAPASHADASREPLLSTDARLADPRAGAAASGALVLSGLTAGIDETQRATLASIGSGALRPRYLESDTGRYLFVQILPAKDFGTLAVIAEPLRLLRSAIAQVRGEHPGLDIGLTGKPVLQADELVTSNRDMVRGAGIGLVLCALLLMVSMHSVVRPLLAVIAFLIAFGWTYGFATLAVGQLNLLSSVFTLVLVAAGLDYGVHVIARYLELRRQGLAGSAQGGAIGGVRGAVRASAAAALRGNITGAATSCAVFATALFTDFQGLRELGIIAGGGLLLCVVATGFMLPALLAIVERPTSRVPLLGKPGHFGLPVLHPRRVLAGLLLLSAGLGVGLAQLRFEDNLLRLQNPALDSVRWERRLAEESSGNSWFGAVIVETIDDVRPILERAAAEPAIGEARSVLDAVAEPTPMREALRRRIEHARVAAEGISATEDASEDSPGALARALAGALPPLRAASLAAAVAAPDEAARLGSLISAVQRSVAALRGEGAQAEASGQTAFASIAASRDAIGTALRAILEGNAAPLRDALPDAARAGMMSPDGRFLVMLHPRENVWDATHMRQFVDALRRVDPDATGVPFTHFESLGDMKRAFATMAILSLLFVAILVYVDFRRLADVLFALLPISLALLWTFEVMGLFRISLNLANFFAVPILIGLGVDSSVHLLHRYHEGDLQEHGDRLDPGSTRRAVVLTNLTTTIGFAPLLFAEHRGMRSLGMVMVIGNCACLAATLLALPALLAWREARRHGGTQTRRG